MCAQNNAGTGPDSTDGNSADAFEASVSTLSALRSTASLKSAIFTHASKIPSTSVGHDFSILDTASAGIGFLHNSGMPGICSPNIKSCSPFSATFSGKDIAAGQDLAVDRDADHPSLFSLAREGRETELLALGLTQQMARDLIQIISASTDRYPSSVSSLQKQVYFEAGSDSILVTPLYPVKFAHEINRRVQDRRARRKAVLEEYKKAGKVLPTEHPDVLRVAYYGIGGANPQNVGAIVNKNGLTTRRGGVPMLIVNPPQDRRTAVQRDMQKLRALATYAAIAFIPADELISYANRSAMNLALAAHRNAEYIHAEEIVTAFLGKSAAVMAVFANFQEGFWSDEDGGWSRFSRDERQWLDPREGEFSLDALASQFCAAVASKIEAAVRREAARGDQGGEGKSVFNLSDRSREALTEAFRAILKEAV